MGKTMASNRGRTGKAWTQLRAAVIANSTHCSACRLPLRPDITDKNHPQFTQVDHTIPLIEGGELLDPANVTAMCRRCNVRKENLRRKQRRSNTSRTW